MARFLRYDQGRVEALERDVVREAAVTIFINGERIGSMMVTPEQLEEFVTGFLFLEGMIQSADEISRIDVKDDEIHIVSSLASSPSERKYRTSALNIVESSQTACGPVTIVEGSLKPSEVLELVQLLNANARSYRETGGVHTSALSCPDGAFVIAEDIGRHNTLDKIVGRCLRERIAIAGGVLVTSGRITVEMIHKAMRMQVPIVISRTSPTDAAIQLAARSNITIVGYARGGAFNVYSHEERITTSAVRN